MKRLLALLALTLPLTATSAEPVAGTAPAASLATDFASNLVALQNGELAPVPREKLAGVKYYALYYSAQWCPPCRRFTPELVKAYQELKAKRPDFELVFVSSDRNADAMRGYIVDYQMAFPAVRYEVRKSLAAAQRYAENGIPNLVFVTAEGEVLSSSYVDGKYVGPRKVLRDIQTKLGEAR